MPEPLFSDAPAAQPDASAPSTPGATPPALHERLTAASEMLLCSGLPTQFLILSLMRAAG
jgi:hypothetical protein